LTTKHNSCIWSIIEVLQYGLYLVFNQVLSGYIYDIISYFLVKVEVHVYP
jgi:hypothetical protein